MQHKFFKIFICNLLFLSVFFGCKKTPEQRQRAFAKSFKKESISRLIKNGYFFFRAYDEDVIACKQISEGKYKVQLKDLKGNTSSAEAKVEIYPCYTAIADPKFAEYIGRYSRRNSSEFKTMIENGKIKGVGLVLITCNGRTYQIPAVNLRGTWDFYIEQRVILHRMGQNQNHDYFVILNAFEQAYASEKDAEFLKFIKSSK